MPAAEVKVPSIPSPLQHSLLTFPGGPALLFYKLLGLHQHCFLQLFPMSAPGPDSSNEVPLACSDGSAFPRRKAALCVRGSAVWAGAGGARSSVLGMLSFTGGFPRPISALFGPGLSRAEGPLHGEQAGFRALPSQVGSLGGWMGRERSVRCLERAPQLNSKPEQPTNQA